MVELLKEKVGAFLNDLQPSDVLTEKELRQFQNVRNTAAIEKMFEAAKNLHAESLTDLDLRNLVEHSSASEEVIKALAAYASYDDIAARINAINADDIINGPALTERKPDGDDPGFEGAVRKACFQLVTETANRALTTPDERSQIAARLEPFIKDIVKAASEQPRIDYKRFFADAESYEKKVAARGGPQSGERWVNQDAKRDVLAVIEGNSAEKPERNPQAVGQALGKMYKNSEYGSHIRWYVPKDFGVNLRTASAAIGQVKRVFKTPNFGVTPRFSVAALRGGENSLQAKAATYGLELFIGETSTSRFAGSLGASVGAQFGSDRLGGWGGAGADVHVTPWESERFHGAMLRVDRRVTENEFDVDHSDPNSPLVRQNFKMNDVEAKQTMGEVAEFIFNNLSHASTEEERAGLLDRLVLEFKDRDLSMTLVDQRTKHQAVGRGPWWRRGLERRPSQR